MTQEATPKYVLMKWKASMPPSVSDGALHVAELSTRWIKHNVSILACYPNWAHRHNIVQSFANTLP